MKCPLVHNCDCHTAPCHTSLPDRDCPWYRWFEKLIEEDKMKQLAMMPVHDVVSITIHTNQGEYMLPLPTNVFFKRGYEELSCEKLSINGQKTFEIVGNADNVFVIGDKMKVI